MEVIDFLLIISSVMAVQVDTTSIDGGNYLPTNILLSVDPQTDCKFPKIPTIGNPLQVFSQDSYLHISHLNHLKEKMTCSAISPDLSATCDDWRYAKMCDSFEGNGEPPINFDKEDAEFREFNGFTFTNYENIMGKIKCINDGIHAECKLKSDDIPSVSGGDLNGTYNFDSMHFHMGCKNGVGSVHHVDDKSYSGELHLVHYKDTFKNLSEAIASGERGAAAILAIFLNISDTAPSNNLYKDFTDNLVDIVTYGEENTFEVKYPLSAFLPSKLSPFFRYYGFVVSSGCHEVIVCSVFKVPTLMTQRQMSPFFNMEDMNGKSICDNHMAQTLNAKFVTLYDSKKAME